jgi:hypothetical protein
MSEDAPVVRKATWRMGARQRERLQWVVVGIICILLVFAFRPTYEHIIQTRDFQTCQSNVLQISRGISLYSDDADGALPLGDSWADSVQGYLEPRSGTGFKVQDIFHCPRDKSDKPSSYAWNTLLDGYSPIHKNMKPGAQLKLENTESRPERIPLVIEKHGSEQNATVEVLNWNDLGRELTRPHLVPDATGSIITGGQKPSSVSQEKLGIRAGDKF